MDRFALCMHPKGCKKQTRSYVKSTSFPIRWEVILLDAALAYFVLFDLLHLERERFFLLKSRLVT